MSEVPGARSFQVSGEAYDGFMGRYSRELAKAFAGLCLPAAGGRFLDVGCGPGALTSVAGERLGAGSVAAIDPSPTFVAACRQRCPGADVRQGRAEELPFDDASFDAAAAQLVLHFVSDPGRVMGQFRRVVRPGGRVAAAVWDFAEGMQMLRAFWDAALSLDSDAPDEARTLRFGSEGELADLFGSAGLHGTQESTLSVSSSYRGFDELWAGFVTGIGPAGTYLATLAPDSQSELRAAMFERLGSPRSSLRLDAVARVAVGTVPA